MKKLYKSEQSGRSMVEMLGVLAIIGVLSVGGIAGYSKAMVKYKTTKTMDQISMLAANIRTAFASSASYTGLSTENARKWGFASSDMYDTAGTGFTNPFLGKINIASASAQGLANMGFFIQYTAIPRDVCVQLATADWGVAGFSGLSSAAEIDATGVAVPGKAITAGTGKISFTDAANICAAEGTTDMSTNLAIFFY